jgi:hypothetical protein
VTEIVKDQHVSKLLRWASTISDENKKGLKLMKTIIDSKGEQKFKAKEEVASNLKNDYDVRTMPADDAKRLFRKMANTTSYAMEFGERPKAVEDFKILQQKELSQLCLSNILKP